jgi:glycosyltransferase involved in cell wall biosynthesis
LVFPGYDDFGLTPLEAAALGRPTIAYAAGGALETVMSGNGSGPGTGVMFAEQTAAGLISGVEEFCRLEAEFDAHRLRAHASQFARREARAALGQFLRQGVPASMLASC